MPKVASPSPLTASTTRTRLFEALPGRSMAQRLRPSVDLHEGQIAERAGVGRTAVYNHFADKEVLLLWLHATVMIHAGC